jgi:Antitoxin MazE-like
VAVTSSGKSSRAKVSAHRRRLRSQGLKPIQIWVPDVRAPGFKQQAHRQSLAVVPRAHQDQSFINAVSDLCLDEGAR